jgi:D-alanyl-D-alanine carboxypeptidase
LRGRRGIAVGFLGALAVATTTADQASARHEHAKHGVHSEDEHAKGAVHSQSAGPPYADIVVDANSGTVLHSANPDELCHPASLTKIMTLYLLFERLEAGKLKLDTPLDVSEHAAAQAPTKLGLKPGQTIAIEDAIRGLVTKSANDAAVVVAEAIGGSERDFAEMMTRQAHALGMDRTVYRNASGLPDAEQVTLRATRPCSAASSRSGFRATIAISRRRHSPIMARRCAITTGSSAMSRGLMASRPAILRRLDIISSPRFAATIGISSASCWAARRAARAMRACEA